MNETDRILANITKCITLLLGLTAATGADQMNAIPEQAGEVSGFVGVCANAVDAPRYQEAWRAVSAEIEAGK